MQVTIQLANDVRRLGREGMTVETIAVALCRPEADVMETLRMLGLPLPGELRTSGPPNPSDDERAALRAKMPKRWQDRQGQAIVGGRWHSQLIRLADCAVDRLPRNHCRMAPEDDFDFEFRYDDYSQLVGRPASIR